VKNLLWKLLNLRDGLPFLAVLAIAGLLFYFVSWWAALIGLVLGYWYFGELTYMQAITAIQQMTGLDYYRANKMYKAGITGDWSEIKTSELQVYVYSAAKGPQRRLKAELSVLIMMERTRRDAMEWWEQEDKSCL
jgi:hypothetical protein